MLKRKRFATAMVLPLVIAIAGCGAENAPEPERKSPLNKPPLPTTRPGGASPRPGPENADRGNTPPGQSRAGDRPAEGTIVDPGGVTKR